MNENLLPFPLLFFCFIPAVLLLLLLLFFNLSNKNKKLPPGPKGLPFVGNLHLIGDIPHESLAKLAKTYGPLMTVKIGMATTIVASSPEMAREILLKNDQVFLGRPVPDAVTALLDYEVTLAWIPGGQHWKKLRKLWKTELFAAHRLDTFRDLRHDTMKNMIKIFDEKSESGEPIHIAKLVFVTSLSLLSIMMFSGNILDPESSEMDEFRDLIRLVMELIGKPNIADIFPFLRPFDPQGIRKKIKVSYDRLRELIETSIDNRKNQRASKGFRSSGDFLDTLLDYNEQDGPQGLDRRDVRLLLMEVLIPGMDTTSTTIEWAMVELFCNPQIMVKAKKELAQTFGPKGFVREQDVIQLPYLDAIVKETLRLHSISPLLLPHRAQKDVEISGFLIPKNTTVVVNNWWISRDPAYWENPNGFEPERFLDADYDFRGGNLSFIPFSAGRRICPGMPIATQMVKLILATLLHNFDWKLANGMDSEDLDMMTAKFGVTLQKDQPLLVIPIKISDH